MELVYVARMLRMGDDSLLVPMRRSVGDRFTGNGKSYVWVVRQVPYNQGTPMGAECIYIYIYIYFPCPCCYYFSLKIYIYFVVQLYRLC